MVMAREAGVKDPVLDSAIERSANLIRFYVGKGAIPYGDSHPLLATHDENGKSGMAAVLFSLLNEPKNAEYFSRMSVASYGAERDSSYTGTFFHMLWALPGVALSGPQAVAAWMRESGTHQFDLARRWDGSFAYQGLAQMGYDNYRGWDTTGSHLLAYALPLKKILLTGKRASGIPQLDAAAAQALIRDGNGGTNKDRNSGYDKMSEAELLAGLASWSPVVRERSAMALARRKNAPLPQIVAMLEAPQMESRYGACQAIATLKAAAAPAVPALIKALDHEDLSLRIKAADALAAIGKPAAAAAPVMLKMLATPDREKDPRGMQQRYLSFALFREREGLLAYSLEGVDRELLYQAVRTGLQNEDGQSRSAIATVYKNLSAEEIRPLLPAVYQAIIEPAPTGTRYADNIRRDGVELLARLGGAEGLPACVKYLRTQNTWQGEVRTPEILRALRYYGVHAKTALPELQKLAAFFESNEHDMPKQYGVQKAGFVREAIAAIEASEEMPELIHIELEAPKPGATGKE